MDSKIIVVVPTIREANIQRFLSAWKFDCPVIVVEDNPEPTFDIAGVQHYCWRDIETDLGEDSWIIPRRTDCIRSYGYWKAWQAWPDVIITLDDDCLPHGQSADQFIAQHLDNLAPKVMNRWHNTLDGAHPRGYPYEASTGLTPIGISHGLWKNVVDFDSLSQLHYGRAGAPGMEYREGVIPSHSYSPMCGMNLAWRAEYTPLMYFLLMGQDANGTPYPYDRFGDIWAGILSKKVLDHLGVGVYSGGPFVNHSRASNVWANFQKEHAGIQANERFWQMVDEERLKSFTPEACYSEIALSFARKADHYLSRVGEAMLRWAALYE